MPAFHLLHHLEKQITQAAHNWDGLEDSFSPEMRPADPRFGDFQANGILPYAKKSKQNPRALAQQFVDFLQKQASLTEIADISIAGPGFINLTLKATSLAQWLLHYQDSDTIDQACQQQHQGQTVVLDYSSPNSAKQMHVGHIRSTVIGEAIANLYQASGATVIRDNHIGDWGTQFGILLMQVKNENFDFNTPPEEAIAQLEQLYKTGNALFQADENGAKQTVYQELQQLQQGDPQNVALWQKINDISYQAFQKIYQKLNIHFDHVLGESFYRDKVEQVYQELAQHHIATLSEGAQVVFHAEHPRFNTVPFIIRKSDGTSNYATTDLATALYRQQEWQANTIVYVTDSRQKDHFEQLFLTLDKWFQATQRPLPQLRHVTFGTILGEDGKAIKTRSGEPIKLSELLSEAQERAYALVTEKNPELDENERREIARVVGIGSVRYADLMQNRNSDYIFAWDKLISFEGNTAPYLLYAVARIHSIFAKAGEDIDQFEQDDIQLETAEELALAKKLMQYPILLEQATQDLLPHTLCGYLFELSGSFSAFYNANKVLVEDSTIKNRRLLLAKWTVMILEKGLHIMGLETLKRM